MEGFGHRSGPKHQGFALPGSGQVWLPCATLQTLFDVVLLISHFCPWFSLFEVQGAVSAHSAAGAGFGSAGCVILVKFRSTPACPSRLWHSPHTHRAAAVTCFHSTTAPFCAGKAAQLPRGLNTTPGAQGELAGCALAGQRTAESSRILKPRKPSAIPAF